MESLLTGILTQFGFTELTIVIGIICMIVLLGNFLGGMMTSMFLAFGGPIKPRKFFSRISVRANLFSEGLLIAFAVYYHLAVIETIAVTHTVYWIFTLLAAPVLAIIGSQLTYIMYSKKIKKNERAYRAIRKKMAEQRAEKNKDKA